ncbi:MAG: 2-keto-4-pentenoate hydratase [Hydrocarboniphaga sp.]|uniref:fumarylacetoacetate hydrolase family protein n=1 Tax=Hydrocarboniphaga sp. TaxID=2033016 RepID=UPI0026231857|nr:fumarylacetoacetate hydrolase family protein [Hydrocarboniphaga sp.]MDB5972006.1 2-keto-4-pentenoate hydratase [Hydrocarboniphaga sp.]
MKLASLRDGSRDGRLVVVSRDLKLCMPAAVATLQLALDRWDEVELLLLQQSDRVNSSSAAGFAPFDPAACLSPLPRAYQWLDGSAYVNHVELVRKARGAEMPASFWTDPLMYQGGSDAFLAPRQHIPLGDAAWGADFEAEIAVVTGDVALGASVVAARGCVRLLMLVNDVSLRNLIPNELAKGFGFLQSKPSSAFSPVAVTPDELGPAWDGGRLHGPLLTQLNGQAFGRPDAGVDMTFDFPTLIAHAARTRPLAAGTIVGSGTVSNRDADGGPGRPIAEGGLGYSCLAELRTVETLRGGKAQTPFLKAGDRVRIEMLDAQGSSIFGAIDQTVAEPGHRE